ncbi:unnamed protein product [Penicillium salamii]|uniref:Zn(2)-C6 fungal-type domain-containing protein n=1 Tax=Penicillium salamii TaxID=1612424 RepID=A0A9W4J3W5_9EURO|nr:unnamed protein product [Penicillium salamii]CAG8369439.1 unnamed protein product [Penicillium salamii]CAG8393679.1 unnamed protein product [Penicillium salamii]
MSMSEASEPQAGWRIPRACQECRKRKIKCSGLNPCTTCQLRNTPCIYRDYIRHRRKKTEYEKSRSRSPVRRASPSGLPPGPRASAMNDFPKSVSATHMASPSCQMQLYYGPSSHFSLMQHIYRDLISNPTAPPEPSGGVEEAGAGLDLFSFRRIFFGTPDPLDGNRPPGMGDISMMFLPYDLAKLFMSRYLSGLYHMLPHRPKAYYEQCLERMYNPCATESLDPFSQAIILIAMACAAIGTDHFAWGDVLFERVKASMVIFDDVVNLQLIQISLLMISRPNSAFLHLGSASRKALSAGLHKDVPHGAEKTPESIEERRVTFWSLYIYETWFCFHTGRPSSLSLKDVAIEHAQDPFLRLLVELCKTITRSTEEIYGQRHESLLHMWRVARSIAHDLRGHESLLKQSLGFGLDAGIQEGSLGVQQTIFTTLFNHTFLLTFRPFLIFRGHWRRNKKAAPNNNSTESKDQQAETPSWLNEACSYAITAAQKTLQHLCEASRENDLVRQLRYHGYFLGSSSFTLIYEFLHDASLAPVYLPWVYASLQTLSIMRAGDPIASSISAIQTVLRRMNPSYEWPPYTSSSGRQPRPSEPAAMGQPAVPNTAQRPLPNDLTIPHDPSMIIRPGASASPWNLPQFETMGMPDTGGSVGSSEDLLDFTQSDMGWDFDFSTMDLEAFLSVYPSEDALF